MTRSKLVISLSVVEIQWNGIIILSHVLDTYIELFFNQCDEIKQEIKKMTWIAESGTAYHKLLIAREEGE
jgi:hypothetical protein